MTERQYKRDRMFRKPEGMRQIMSFPASGPVGAKKEEKQVMKRTIKNSWAFGLWALIGLVGVPDNASAAVTDGLEGYWTLDGLGDLENTVTSTPASLNDDAAFTPGLFSNGVVLDGLGDSIHLEHEAALNPGAGFGWTISLWFNGQGVVPADFDLLFQKLDLSPGFLSWTDGFGVWFAPAGAGKTQGFWYIGQYATGGGENLVAAGDRRRAVEQLDQLHHDL